jgi:hypothetical protein
MVDKEEFTVAVLGDLHLDPRYMDDHFRGREHIRKVLEDGKRPNSFVVSLGGKFHVYIIKYGHDISMFMNLSVY